MRLIQHHVRFTPSQPSGPRALMNPEPGMLVEILDGVPDAVVRAAVEGRVVYANRCFREWFCPADEGMSPLTVAALSRPAQGLDLAAWHERGLRATPAGERFVVQLPSGESGAGRRWFDVVVTPVRADGRIEGTQTVLRDITALKQAEADQARLQARLFITQKYEALGTLAGGIAHDFNNILSGIINFTTLARDVCPPEHTDVRAYLGEVLQSGQRAKELVRQIQLFRRSEGEQRVPFPIQNVVKEAVSLLRSTLPAAINIRSEVGRNLPLVLANPLQVHQIVMNLSVNSVETMRERGSTLQVRLAPCAVDEAEAQAVPGLRPGRYVCLEVEDDGCGMDPAVLARAYDPYFTTREVGEGSGLGLPVVYSIVRHHGGAMRISSRPGEGTRVDVYFPVNEAAAAPEPAGLGELPRGHGQHILLVDDEAPVARSAQLILEHLGYRVSVFTHPEEALAAFWSEPEQFDALVTDFQMPAMTGLDLSRKVRAARPGLPVFVLSGFAGNTSDETLREQGITARLQKPFEIAELAERLAGIGRAPGGGME